MQVVRTDKQLEAGNLSEKFTRTCLKLASLSNLPLRADLQDFKVEEIYVLQKGNSTLHVDPGKGKVREGYEDYARVLDCLEISLKGLDTLARVRPNGRMVGVYVESRKVQYTYNAIDYVNLLLEEGFIEAV